MQLYKAIMFYRQQLDIGRKIQLLDNPNNNNNNKDDDERPSPREKKANAPQRTVGKFNLHSLIKSLIGILQALQEKYFSQLWNYYELFTIAVSIASITFNYR